MASTVLTRQLVRWIHARVLLIAAILVGALALPFAPGWASELLPQVNSGGHTSKINDLKISSNGRFIASVGQDKVIYIWDLEQPDRPARTLRGESGDGPFGFLHAVAISPAGDLVAVGGWTRPRVDGACDPCEIRLYDTETREIRALLTGHGAPVQALAFSSDGRWLLSGDDGGTRSIGTSKITVRCINWKVCPGRYKVLPFMQTARAWSSLRKTERSRSGDQAPNPLTFPFKHTPLKRDCRAWPSPRVA